MPVALAVLGTGLVGLRFAVCTLLTVCLILLLLRILARELRQAEAIK